MPISDWFCLSMLLIKKQELLFYIYFPRFSPLGWLCSFYRCVAFLLDILALLSLLLFLHIWNGTILNNIRTASLSQHIFRVVFTFNVLLFLPDIIIFCFIFIIVWLFSSFNLCASITALWFFCFFLSLSITYRYFVL